MAGITFENYIVHDLSYENNMEFFKNYVSNEQRTTKISLDPHFRSHINIKNDEAVVSLTVIIDEEDKENTPFTLYLTLVGFFTYNKEEADNVAFEDFLTNSAIAMLFPFLRAKIAEVTGGSNVYPSMLLPVMNVAEMLERDDAIKVTVSKDEQD